MATPYDVGHAMRRRSGIPSNYPEATGNSMARSIPTSDENYAAAVSSGSARVTYGAASDALSQVDETSQGQFQGTLVPKHSTQAADPTAGVSGIRQNIERIGASYRIQASYNSLVDPAAAETMHSARLVPSVHARNTVDFGDAAQRSSL